MDKLSEDSSICMLNFFNKKELVVLKSINKYWKHTALRCSIIYSLTKKMHYFNRWKAFKQKPRKRCNSWVKKYVPPDENIILG